ncbi:MAG TPA: hypothetical protein VFV78_01120 [Vicinamibacterales bacterium]|nr:hypothetical protein [Vicinamibacterales bacterium]
MRAVARHIAVLAVIIGLLSGLGVPFSARPEAADPDGACGPSLNLPRSVVHVDAGRTQNTPDHCLTCHLRHDLAGAFVASAPLVVSPVGSVAIGGVSLVNRHDLIQFDDAAPRGPPARS